MFKVFINLILFFVTHSVLAATCFNPKTECIEPGSTKYFDSVPVTLDCWKYRTTYECKESSDNNCKQLKEQGCSPGSATCKVMWGGVCAVQEVTYDCPNRKCDGREIVCNNPDAFCATGNCVPHERSKDQDMHRSLAALSAAAEAAKYYDEINADNLKIFTGKSRECSKNIASGITKDCCGITPSGFLEGKILECDDGERELARAKEERRVVEIGEYCHNEVLGVCTSYHRTYCVFGSKLSRILQAAGRSQLGISFGSPENANCRGLTQEEFKRIDFSKIDFSEFYKDIDNNMRRESTDGVGARAKQSANEFKKHAENYRGSADKMREKMQNKMRDSHTKSDNLNEAAIKSRDHK